MSDNHSSFTPEHEENSQAGKPPAQTNQAAHQFKPYSGNVATSMLIIVIAVFMAILDTSIVNVAIPKMMAVFGVGTTDVEWVLTAYTLVVGALVPVTGYLGDQFGYKRIFLISLAIFTIGSGLCGAAWSNGSMIVFRILQAVGGGALIPLSTAMIYRMFPPERRGFAMGIFGIAIMCGPATGPTLSGYITEYLNWRLIFYVNVPIGIVEFFLALIVLQEFERIAQKRSFDIWGFITSSAGFSSLLYGLGKVSDKGWSDLEVVTFLFIAASCLTLFVAIELTVKEPMLDLRILGNSVFTLSLTVTSIASVVLMGSIFLIPVFLQNISGLSAVQTGLLLLPQAVVTGIMMPISGSLFDKFGAKWLAFFGLVITSYSLYLTQYLDVNTPFSTLETWLLIRAVGIGMVMMPVSTAGMNAIPMHKIGHASALQNTIRQVAGSFGIAWLALIFSQRTTFHSAIGTEIFNMNSLPANLLLGQTQTVLSDQQSSLQYIWSKLQLAATVQAMDDVFWVTVWLTLAGAVFALFLKDTKAKLTGQKEQMVMSE